MLRLCSGGGGMLCSVVVSCLATRARGRSLSSRRWTTRRPGHGAVIGMGRIVREHPLAHGICSQLLRILYLTEFNGIDGHGYNGGRKTLGEGEGENDKYDDNQR
ncbi:hypothetical protein F5888DRAFT_1688028 [Russula emetica]|nr:hypothetical protein F5888DRAFT_1688028 [Russula emetica]